MNLSRKWLSEFVDVRDIPDHDYAYKMTMSGSIVEGITDIGAEIKNVVVGKLLSVEPHPNADKLVVCSVDVGASEPIQILTGAKNVSAGCVVPVALCGADLPGGVHIEKTDMRGLPSYGMLCSMGELGLDQRDLPAGDPNGILLLNAEGMDVLPENYSLGDDIRPILGLDDHVAEFEITPNRPDCLSVIGLARETAATFERPLTLHTPTVKGGAGSISDYLSVEVLEPTLCPRYVARVVKNVKIAPSPKWMRERLRAEGVRPINNIVDITNYVMLEYGQPMHAFDYECLGGGRIVVRRAKAGETMSTLDSKPRALTPDMLVIADGENATAVAGVMGGAESEITEGTTTIVFESANFDGATTRRTAVALGMRTDASARFEKGLDPENTIPALDRACELVELLGCGEVADGLIDVNNTDYKEVTLPLECDRINALLGCDLSEDYMVSALRRLFFTVEGTADGHIVRVPSFRMDVGIMNDLAEEVARIYGYDELPMTLAMGAATVGGYTPRQQAENNTNAVCRSLGYTEILTYSFTSPTFADRLRLAEDSPLRRTLRITNPLGEDRSVMRTTALGSILEAAGKNYASRVARARIYELAKVYIPQDDGSTAEPKRLTLAAYGESDFFELKGAVEAILNSMNLPECDWVQNTDGTTFHPGRCAELFCGGRKLGVVGQIHPTVAEDYGVETELYAAELDYEAMLESRGAEPTFKPLPRFPATTRDMAVVCDESVPAGELLKTVRAAAGDLLVDASIFDVYTGVGILPGKKSVAMSLAFRADDRTLTDAEVDERFNAALAAVEQKHGASLR